MAENSSNTIHATLVFDRVIAASSNEVFEAFADFEVRAAWSTPSETAVIIYDEADFRPGGVDRFRCGSRANPDIHGTTHYIAMDRGRLLVASETIDMAGRRLCAALNTIELTGDEGTTRLKHTSQIVSFAGEDMIKGHIDGNTAALDNLVRHFDKLKAGERSNT